LKGRKLRAVCGDHVLWQASGNKDNDHALVTKINERHNALERADTRGKAELIAANLSPLVVVLAPEPEPDFFIADRYISAAEMMGAEVLIIWNKTDLQVMPPDELACYQQMGYTVIPLSTKTGTGMDELITELAAGVSMLVGQSGVGKSSLINILLPSADVAVGLLSTASREGRHTTTASFMHSLANGGQLIDSPGVREFKPIIPDATRMHAGFREIAELAPECRFADCRHLREPGCAAKLAVEEGRISTRRYESYKRLNNISTGPKK